MPLKRMVVMKSSDGKEFEVEEAVAMESTTVKNMLVDSPVPVVNIRGKTLAKVIDYCKGRHDANSDRKMEEFDAEFIRGVEKDCGLMFELIMAANYLGIPGLEQVTTRHITDHVMGRNYVNK